MNITELNPDDSQWERYISPRRCQKMKRYLHEKDRALSLGVELLLNDCLGDMHPGIKRPVVWEEDENGKLHLPDHPHIHFNLSHAGDYSVCAVSDKPVGVDIEYCAGFDLKIAKNYFFGLEYEYIMEKPEAEWLDAFYELWVLKESYMKATGLGFQLALDAFYIYMQDKITVIQEGRIKPFNFFLAQFEEYKLAVCYSGHEHSSVELEVKSVGHMQSK
ncbi:MAG: 4'-phosphopantetheinyl transferase superfamily protein [Syntrophomonas sp.]